MLRFYDETNITVFAKDLSIHKELLETCNLHNIQCYTYTPKNEKAKNIILKGIRGNFSTMMKY